MTIAFIVLWIYAFVILKLFLTLANIKQKPGLKRAVISYKHAKTRFLLVGQLEFVPLEFLRSERVAFVSGKVKHMGAGVFMNPND